MKLLNNQIFLVKTMLDKLNQQSQPIQKHYIKAANKRTATCKTTIATMGLISIMPIGGIIRLNKAK